MCRWAIRDCPRRSSARKCSWSTERIVRKREGSFVVSIRRARAHSERRIAHLNAVLLVVASVEAAVCYNHPVSVNGASRTRAKMDNSLVAVVRPLEPLVVAALLAVVAVVDALARLCILLCCPSIESCMFEDCRVRRTRFSGGRRGSKDDLRCTGKGKGVESEGLNR